jgi:hypothetical protein
MTGTRFVLAVSASPRGFAFVLFQGPTTPFDWGVKEFRGPHKSALTLLAIKKLMREYRPERVVLEETGKGSRRGPRIRALYRDVIALAGREQVPVARFTKEQVRAAFAPALSRRLQSATHPLQLSPPLALQRRGLTTHQETTSSLCHSASIHREEQLRAESP